jgi:hypothetical protein
MAQLRLLWDDLVRHAFRLDSGVPVTVAYQPGLTRRYALRIVLDAGLREDGRIASGSMGLLTTILGSSFADRSQGHFPGLDAELGYYTVELCLTGPDLPALCAEAALRLSAPPPTEAEGLAAWDSFLAATARVSVDTDVQVANFTHRIALERDSPHAFTWPCGNRYHARPSAVPYPGTAALRKRYELLNVRRLRAYVVSSTDGPGTEALMRASPLAWWQPKRPEHVTAVPTPKSAPLRAAPNRYASHTYRAPVTLPSGEPGMTTLWALPTLGSDDPRSAYLDLLARAPGWPFTVSSWVHPGVTMLGLWAQSSLLDAGGPARLVRDVQRALRPILEGQRQDVLWASAARALDADRRALLRDPAALSRAIALADGRSAPAEVPRTLDPVAVTAAMAALAKGFYAPRCGVILPEGAAWSRAGFESLMIRPLSSW